MAYTTINKSTEHFNTKLYTGTGSSNAISGVGFKPDLVWIKPRNEARGHNVQDSVRGTGNLLNIDTSAEYTGRTQEVTSFDSDGFTVGTSNDVNKANNTHASWNWKANGAGSTNYDGSITSTVSANTTSGFSIVSFTGTGADDTVGHGLGVAPKMIITKARGTTNNWGTYHHSLGNNDAVFLNLTNGTNDYSGYWNTTTPTSSVFSVGVSPGTNSSATMIAYCFAEKTGYSKFGSYVGNGSSNGTFVYTGFKPAFLLIKKTNEAKNWFLHDNKRLGYNPSNSYLNPNLNVVEQAETDLDMLSNGFKMRSTGGGHNQSSHTYIYMAFAEAPLVGTNNVPCTAR